MPLSDYNSFPEFNTAELFAVLQHTKDGISSVQALQLCSLEMAAAIYLHRTTGLQPIVTTNHGRFKLSYKHCVRLCVYHDAGMNHDELRAKHQGFVNDFVDVWEHPLLD